MYITYHVLHVIFCLTFPGVRLYAVHPVKTHKHMFLADVIITELYLMYATSCARCVHVHAASSGGYALNCYNAIRV